MRTSCASDLPSHLVRQLGRLPELLDEITNPALFGMLVCDGFGNPVAEDDLLGRFAYTGLEEPKKGSGTVEISHNSPSAGGIEP